VAPPATSVAVADEVASPRDRARPSHIGAGGGVGGIFAGHDGLADDEIPVVDVVRDDQDAAGTPAVVVDDRAMVQGDEVPKALVGIAHQDTAGDRAGVSRDGGVFEDVAGGAAELPDSREAAVP